MIKSLVAAFAVLGVTAISSFAFGAGAPAPSANALSLASRLIVDIGVRGSLDAVVPDMLQQLEGNVVQTHPETKDAIHAVALAIAPEFGKTEQGVLDAVTTSLASHMSEQALTAAVTFFESPQGVEFVKAQPFMLQDMSAAAGAWRQKLSVDMVTRAREELKKKGFDF